MDHSFSRQRRRTSLHGQGLDFLAWGLRFSGTPLETVGMGGPKRRQAEGGPGTLVRWRAPRAAGAVGPVGEHAGLLARGSAAAPFGAHGMKPYGDNGVARESRLPDDPVGFIQDRIRRGQVLWTYHVNMRLTGRFIPRESILAAVDTYELVEAYPDDKYLPSYLLLGRREADMFHVLFAADVEGDNVRVVTAYRPDRSEWQEDLKNRRSRR